jgi:hypothetical protein
MTEGLSLGPGRVEFSLLHVVQTECGPHPASYSKGIKGSFPWPGGKVARV